MLLRTALQDSKLPELTIVCPQHLIVSLLVQSTSKGAVLPFSRVPSRCCRHHTKSARQSQADAALRAVDSVSTGAKLPI